MSHYLKMTLWVCSCIVTLNGKQIYSEALEDLDKLEIKLRSEFEEPQPFMIG